MSDDERRVPRRFSIQKPRNSIESKREHDLDKLRRMQLGIGVPPPPTNEAPTGQFDFACKVCHNTPDAEGNLEHGLGCYHLSAEGGGTEYIVEADRKASLIDRDRVASILIDRDRVAFAQHADVAGQLFGLDPRTTSRLPDAISTERRVVIAGAAQEAFWKVVAEMLPEAKTGDMAVTAVMEFSRACDRAIEVWARTNVRLPEGASELAVKLATLVGTPEEPK